MNGSRLIEFQLSITDEFFEYFVIKDTEKKKIIR